MPRKTRSDPALLCFVGFLTLLGGYVRISPLLASSFPLNDGGLFYSMTRDLIANQFRLPLSASYNALQVAYAYPPLAFYLAGGLAQLFGWPLLDIFRLLPALVSALTIPAFYLLARDLLKSKAQVLLAVFFFAFMPSAFYWPLMGGGLTRGLGLFFSILAFWALLRLYRRPLGLYTVFWTGLFTALAILSHPEAALHTVSGALVFFVFFDLSRKGLLKSALSGALTLLLTAPWWGTVLASHGLGPFLAAGSTGGYRLDLWLSFFQLNLADEVALTFIGCLAMLGVFALLAKKELFLPVWSLLVILVSPRSAVQHLGLCLALLAALALDELVLPRLRELEQPVAPTPAAGLESLFAGRTPKILFAYLLIYFIVAAYSVVFNEVRSLSLSAGDQQAFAWITAHLQPAGRFALITGDQPLGDPAAEWFPALTGQVSAATVQGYEWIPGRPFDEILRQSFGLQLCAMQDAACVQDWQAKTGVAFEYLYLDKQRIRQNQGAASGPVYLQKSLLETNQYEIIYETPAVTILQARK